MRKLACFGALLLVAGALGACGGSKTSGAKGTQELGTGDGEGSGGLKIPKVDKTKCDTKDKRVSTFDLDRDNRPDVWKLHKVVDERGTTLEILTCKQVDLDHDSKIDYVAQYDDDGSMLLEEFDFDFDGKFDARRHYDKKTGKVYLVERSTGFDGKPNIWEKYDANEKVETIFRDRNGDGKPDYWEQYATGTLVAILYDDDYDGKVDRRDDAKQTASAPAPAAPDGDDAGGDDAGGEDDDTSGETDTGGDDATD